MGKNVGRVGQRSCKLSSPLCKCFLSNSPSWTFDSRFLFLGTYIRRRTRVSGLIYLKRLLKPAWSLAKENNYMLIRLWVVILHHWLNFKGGSDQLNSGYEMAQSFEQNTGDYISIKITECDYSCMPPLYYEKYISMALCKTAVSPARWQWGYCSLALSHRNVVKGVPITWICHSDGRDDFLHD